MIGRYLLLCVTVLFGAVLAAWMTPQAWAAWGEGLGAVAGAAVWAGFDAWRSGKVLGWLRRGSSADTPVRGGVWGEVVDRARRQLRKRERQHQESEARLQDFLAALQASPSGVVLIDAQGRIEWFNQTASSHFGLDARRDLLQHFLNLVRDPTFTNYFSSGDYQSSVVVPGRENSIRRPVRLSVQLHPYGGGRRLLLSRDITLFEQAEVMRRDFVANVSHEIRTPLTVLAGFVETLQSLELDAQERARYLDLMAEQARRMQSLVHDLLTLSKLEGSPPPGEGEWVAVNHLLRQTEQEARSLSAFLYPPPALPQQIQCEVAEDCEISGFASELLSAMSNLFSNAVRYTPAGGSIQTGWRGLPGGRYEFFVQDTGAGIAMEHIPRLTERFYRVDRSRSRDTGGTGLGLAIVKHVVQRHGAALDIQSTLGRGSRFSILFPASRVRSVKALSLVADAAD